MNITNSLISTARRILPQWVMDQFKGDWNEEGFKKYFHNTGWMFLARMVTFLTSFLTIAIVARYLGPANLGKLEYAQSIVAIISVFASLGIDQILYRDLVANTEEEDELLGTAIISKLFFGTFAFMLSVAVSILLDNEPLITGIIALVAATFLLSPIGTIGILFHARIKSKYSSQITIFLAFFIPALKLILVYLGQGIIYFAAILLIEAVVSAAWVLYIYVASFHGRPRAWRFRLDVFKSLMHDSWPLLFAGFSGYIYAKIDQVMLLHFLDATTVGIYSAAVKLTQIWAFLPGLIIGSLFPALINSKTVDYSSYARRFKSLAKITITLTSVIAIPLFIFASQAILLVFGSAFIDASSLLRVYLWVSIAITIIALFQNFLIAENFGKIFLYSSIIGASANITLNLILIPLYGAHGAAWGTMLSYFIIMISLFFFRDSRVGIMRILRAGN